MGGGSESERGEGGVRLTQSQRSVALAKCGQYATNPTNPTNPANPVGALEPLQPEATDSGPAIATRRTILVVDDEAEIRDTLTAILTGAEHRVVTASSGHEALERMAVESFDVILTDIRMPDLDGRGLYQELERRWPDEAGRVVFVTTDTLTSSRREFVDASGRVVIEKPFLPAEVRRVVAEMVTRASERKVSRS